LENAPRSLCAAQHRQHVLQAALLHRCLWVNTGETMRPPRVRPGTLQTKGHKHSLLQPPVSRRTPKYAMAPCTSAASRRPRHTCCWHCCPHTSTEECTGCRCLNHQGGTPGALPGIPNNHHSWRQESAGAANTYAKSCSWCVLQQPSRTVAPAVVPALSHGQTHLAYGAAMMKRP
jgi:hypothetical protein